MKKKIILLMTLAVFTLAGCSSSTPTTSTDSAEVEKLKSQIEKLEQENADLKAQLEDASQQQQENNEPDTPTEDDTNTDDTKPESNDEVIEIGTEGTLGDWSITATATDTVDSIPDGYGSFSPDEGNKYFVVSLSITNNGKAADTFLPSFSLSDDIRTKILYGDGYEFSSIQLLGYSRSLYDETLNPLSSKEGDVIFTIPDNVASSEDELILQFTMGKNALSIKVR